MTIQIESYGKGNFTKSISFVVNLAIVERKGKGLNP